MEFVWGLNVITSSPIPNFFHPGMRIQWKGANIAVARTVDRLYRLTAHTIPLGACYTKLFSERKKQAH